MLARVKDGTGGGRKRPLRERVRENWRCVCRRVNPPYATRCLSEGCNLKREG